ncbi:MULTISPECIES: MBL fold metallo-hydrolase [unclassified Mesorhizobium]|uniref:MBL fold metallo-hydrolase n=1 Tax=unclassified Mesorhizobium TaxID=325217 RepID=UPI001AEEF044|nr:MULTISPECIES: MBL fold metallo-hydrolase [unclassified Mesorhizobium]MBZ9894376.1 MBL fold metallo-hydrolase [Mesorhizobium sp. BR1-1-6]
MPVLPGVGRVVAPNPGPMTYHGTNTYLLDRPEGTFVLDPGPDDAGHVAAVIAAIKTSPAGILVSHAHYDHIGALPMLKAALGVPTYAFGKNPTTDFIPDRAITNGDVVADLTALHTPGHAPDHLCFCGPDGTVFTGDHVMGWSSTVVSAPLGDMRAYFVSLQLMIDRSDKVYLPGHGPALFEPLPHVCDLLERRQTREKEILKSLTVDGMSVKQISDALYRNAHPKLMRAAQRNVDAHLIKLQDEGKAWKLNELWYPA